MRRAVTLAWALFACMVRFGLLRMRGPVSLERRALWAQEASRGVLNGLGIHTHVQGQPPTHGLVVSNHLSYLDILILSSEMPCFFVAKIEIAAWPFFGHAARACGTLFINRGSLSSALTVSRQIADRLKLPVPILFFPEGTTSDGSSLLRFHSRFFEPAILAQAPVTTAALRYVIEDGTPERELCWFGDDLFLPHLLKALGTPGFTARVRFGQPKVYDQRRQAADQTHTEIAAMRHQLPLP
jgi:1-acyl-sn-glycerol-3-phosphate acyltransferase